MLGKYGGDPEADKYIAESAAAFRRAFELNPDLSLAHNLYTYAEVDDGRAKDAMVRLLERLRHRSSDPELYAGLVHACRYCGVLDASIAASAHARRLYFWFTDDRGAFCTSCRATTRRPSLETPTIRRT